MVKMQSLFKKNLYEFIYFIGEQNFILLYKYGKYKLVYVREK